MIVVFNTVGSDTLGAKNKFATIWNQLFIEKDLRQMCKICKGDAADE